MKRGLVGAEVSADHTGSNRCLPVLCCGFKQTLSYKRMYTYVFIRARAHTGPACSCVLVSSALGSCGLAGFSNTHALCLCCARRPPVVWPHTIPAHLQHHIAPKYLFSCRPLTATPGFDILIRLKNYVQLCLGYAHTQMTVLTALIWSLGRGVQSFSRLRLFFFTQ